jgi:hypothetical protein
LTLLEVLRFPSALQALREAVFVDEVLVIEFRDRKTRLTLAAVLIHLAVISIEKLLLLLSNVSHRRVACLLSLLHNNRLTDI